LAVALALAIYGSAAAAVGGRTGRASLVESAQHAALGVFTLVTGCLLLLAYAFLSFDFSVRYVATNTNLGTPFYYLFTAFWGALLVTGRVGDAWITTARRWTITAWYFLSLGLLIGGWWSYHVLGWGGYWAWDPVENAAFMPWLTGTAFLHSVMIQERRRMLRLW